MARRRIIRQLWARHRIASIGLLLALVLTAGFGTRMVVATLFWSDPSHWQEEPAGWMTIGFISKSWRIPPDVLIDALSTDARVTGRMRLEELATRLNISTDELLDDVAQILAEQERQQ